MAKNVFNNNKPTAQVSMNAFDNGQFQVYSTKAGIGLPCFYLHVTPKEKVRLNVQNYLVAENLRQNAFLRAKQNIDFFFVPYRQLNHMFSPLYYGRDDKQHAFQLNQNAEVPIFDLTRVVNGLRNMYCVTRIFELAKKAQWSVLKENLLGEMALLTFEDYLFSLVHGIDTYYQDTSLDTFIAMWNNSDFDMVGSDFVYFDYDYLHFSEDEFADLVDDTPDWSFIKSYIYHGNSTVEDCIRTLDMLGYGNLYPYFKCDFNDGINNYLKENDYDSLDSYFASQFLNQYDGQPAFYPTSLVHNFFNVVNDLLEYTFKKDSRQCSANAFALMAYQKIFDNVYRNNVVVPRWKFGADLVLTFNSDGLSTQNLTTKYRFGAFCAYFLCPWYIQNRRNLTNGYWNDAQFGDVSKVITESDYSSEKEVSIPDLRMAFAMQTFRERLLRCGDKEKDLLRGLFGTKSRYVGDEYVYYIGSYDGVFNVNTVQDVSGENLGRLGGNIISSVSGHTLNFTSEDFGVIIGIHSILPTMVYPAFGIDAQNTKSEQFDFFHPDFENLGLQPVLRWHYLYPYASIRDKANEVVGYSARFLEYKQKLDVSHGTFADAIRERSDGQMIVERGVDSDYVTNFNLMTVGTPEAQYVSPDALDNIFDTLTDYSLESDHFKTWLNVQCDTLCPMSVLGLPQLA